MNYNVMNDMELMDHLSMTSDDPLVRRLVKMLDKSYTGLVKELIEAGMDQNDWRFEGDYEYFEPGDYIRHLRNRVECAESDARSWEDKYDDACEERNRLKARSVAQLVSEMESEVRKYKDEKYASDRNRERVEKENKELRDKINVWTILEKT
jgi:restriction endonuclease